MNIPLVQTLEDAISELGIKTVSIEVVVCNQNARIVINQVYYDFFFF